MNQQNDRVIKSKKCVCIYPKIYNTCFCISDMWSSGIGRTLLFEE